MGFPRSRGRILSLYLTVVHIKSLIHLVFSLINSHGLMLLISFADVVRMPVVEEVKVRVNVALR